VNRVAVRILHAEGPPDAGTLERSLAGARMANAERLLFEFLRVGVADVEVRSNRPDGIPFGARLRALVADSFRPTDGIVVLGSGSIPLAREADLRALVETAASGERRALVNNRYSADVVALGRVDGLASVPDLAGDNALPRWLEEVAQYEVGDLRRRSHLAMDIDSPLDLVLLDREPADEGTERARDRLEALRAIADDRRAELLVAGRTSATTLRWLEGSTSCRVRALIEERGLRASARVALAPRSDARPQRPPRSILGLALDDRGPGALGSIVAELADGAFIDTRVLLAHRLGADESAWPPPEDRFASDLLLAERIVDPWLQALTAAALDAPVPILLGGHSLVGPGIRLALGRRR
jgi:hypothetical protein